MYEESDEEDGEVKISLNVPFNNAASIQSTFLFGETISVEMIHSIETPLKPACTTTNDGSEKYVLLSRNVQCDVLCFAHLSDSVCDLHTRLFQGIQQQVIQTTDEFVQFVSNNKNRTNILVPDVEARSLLFCPANTSFPVGAVFLTVINEGEKDTLEREEPTRKSLHDATLTKYSPTFRRCNSWDTSSSKSSSSTKILNVHSHCPLPTEVSESNGQGYKLHMVTPGYRYYHYMQDKFDDKGWGCAYRSLQTLWSWFEINSYTNKSPPNHQSIQETLVKVDPTKHSSFVGSKEWIGSQGVGYVLDECLGITSKFIFVPSGNELKSKARAMAQHFDVHGTPIMMGGGALAFTILGVAWHEGTGDMSMLILDPHYCGQDDDMNNIVGKEAKLEGYKARPCGWRRPESFESQAFYNLCCPQRPKDVV